eukprot:gene22082-28589_t
MAFLTYFCQLFPAIVYIWCNLTLVLAEVTISRNSTSRERLQQQRKYRLEKIDGLANADVSVVITSTENVEKIYLRSRIIPSARTWMRYFTNVFVVIDDTTDIRFAMRHCNTIETSEHTAFKCPNEPTYLLTRKCKSSEYYMRFNAIGCKLDEAINFIANESPALFAHTKFVIEADDDVYLRGNVILKWLAKVDRSGSVGNMNAHLQSLQSGKQGEGGLYNYKGCTEIKANWYQPLMINHAALEKIRVATRSYAISNIIYEFNLFQDACVGVLFWMYQFSAITFPHEDTAADFAKIELRHSAAGATGAYVNSVKHRTVRVALLEDECNPEGNWPDAARFNQTLAIGCGSLKQKGPLHNASISGKDMYDLWDFYKRHGRDYEPKFTAEKTPFEGPEWINISVPVAKNFNCRHTHLFSYEDIAAARDQKGRAYNSSQKLCHLEIPHLLRMEGYQFTNHSRRHDILKQWANFTKMDCMTPGRQS